MIGVAISTCDRRAYQTSITPVAYRTIEEAHRALEELRAEYDGDFGVKA